MSNFKKAERLEEVARETTVGPLQIGDPRYVDLSPGRQIIDLKILHLRLKDAAQFKQYAKIAFTGHRGCGKTTELNQLENELSEEFFSVHLFVDPDLENDFNYTDLFLWLVEELASRFAKEKISLNNKLVDDVVDWFAKKTFENVESVKQEITAEAEGKAETRIGLYWVSLKLLARIRSIIVGNIDKRKTIRRELQNYSEDLIEKINLLLEDARQVVQTERGRELLIMQDNLDRLAPDVARQLFIDNGEQLKKPQVHIIYTKPPAIALGPGGARSSFDIECNIPTVKVINRDGTEFSDGIQTLVNLVAARIDIDKVFESVDVVHYLVKISGGNVRDLMRLLNYSQFLARVAGKERIDQKSAYDGVQRLRLEFERALVPEDAYYPLFAQVHSHKALLGEWVTPADDKDIRNRFNELLTHNYILNYDGGENWYDVHPVIKETEGFKNALKKLQKATSSRI